MPSGRHSRIAISLPYTRRALVDPVRYLKVTPIYQLPEQSAVELVIRYVALQTQCGQVLDYVGITDRTAQEVEVPICLSLEDLLKRRYRRLIRKSLTQHSEELRARCYMDAKDTVQRVDRRFVLSIRDVLLQEHPLQ
jgi:hypothetical protein